MAWVYLVIGGCFETIWAIGLKYTEGFTRFWPSVVTVLGMIVSFAFLSFAMKEIPVGTAYAVWAGIGAVGTVIVGILFLGEPRDLPRLAFVSLIVLGIVGLRFASKV